MLWLVNLVGSFFFVLFIAMNEFCPSALRPLSPMNRFPHEALLLLRIFVLEVVVVLLIL